MHSALIELKNHFQFSAYSSFEWGIGLFCLLGLLLSLGRRLEPAVRLERLGIPIALIIGLFCLLIGPYGQIHILPLGVTGLWEKLPTPLLTLVFATLMLGRPIPKSNGLWKPVASQAFLGLLLGFGQYLVGGLAVLFILGPYLGVDPLMGCLIEVGFEGGHGAAAIMGESFKQLGFQEGLDLGFAMATVGLLSSTVIGSGLVVFGRWRGWVVSSGAKGIGNTGGEELMNDFWDQLQRILVNLFFVGLAVLFGVVTLFLLRMLSNYFDNNFYKEFISVFPVFPLALIGSLLVRFLIEITEKTHLISQILQREISTLATDLLIITAMASINLPLLLNDWIPLTVLSLLGLSWNLAGMLIFARFTFREEWFERSITEFGNATGVAASGLLLLRLADPTNLTKTLPIFSIKQLFLQPILSGGIVTVLAPLAVTELGLQTWTELCGLLTLIFLMLSFSMKGLASEDKIESFS